MICSNHREEMADFLKKNGFDPSETVGMMTAVHTEDVVLKVYEESSYLFIGGCDGWGRKCGGYSQKLSTEFGLPAWNDQHLGVCKWKIDRRGIYSMYYDCH